MSLVGTFDVKGKLGRTVKVKYQLQDSCIHVLDGKDQIKEQKHIEHVEKHVGDAPSTFILYFIGESMKKNIHKATSQEEADMWVKAIEDALRAKGTLYTYNYGLPDKDPRTSLPIMKLPTEYVEHFKHLNSAVVHWIGPVHKLGVGWKKEDRIVVIGDKCIYICRKNADITRCIAIVTIKKLLLAQDNSKSLFVACLMPETVRHYDLEQKKEVDAPEYDIMFHSKDIQTVVRYIRTLYLFLRGENLPLEQVTSKEQLSDNVRLTRPKEWKLHFCMPQKKADLKVQLDSWEAEQNNSNTGAESGSALALGAPAAAAPAAPAAAGPAPAAPAAAAPPASGAQQFTAPSQATGSAPAPAAQAKAVEQVPASDYDEDAFMATPLGKFLVMVGLSRYGQVMCDNNMDLEMLVSGLIDDSDLFHFGIESADHRRKLITGLHNKSLITRLTGGKTLDYNPPVLADAPAPAAATGFGGAKPKEPAAVPAAPASADESGDLDLDLGDDLGGFDMGGGGDDIDLGDFDLDLDDIDLGAAPAGGGDDLDLDLDDLDLDGDAGGGDDDLDLDLDI